ncbi:MAG: shikimate kinase, partial [Pirellulaceae bacterium]
MNKHLWLIGYRGSGKSSVARRLAQRLDCSSIDTDDLIEQIAGRSIAEIFAESGEPVFRDFESQAVVQAAEMPTQVIASGGGAILREEN